MPYRHARHAALAATVLLILSACERAPTPEDERPDIPAPVDARGDNAFQVRVTLSDNAAAALQAEDEHVVISADYFGYPTVGAQQRNLAGTEEPWLRLAQHDVRLDGAGTAEFPQVALDRDQLRLVEQGRAQLRVDAYSATAANGAEENLLDCGTFQGPLSVAVRNGVDIDCKLIAE